jgi:nicotinate-nucleotide adenylyltransferase
LRVAIFGGTFDPIHTAHLEIAREAAEQFQLDRVLFIPAANPPHKTRSLGANFEHRFRMVELACAIDRRFVPSRMEEGAEKSYSILTIEKVRAEYASSPKGCELYFLIGSDAFAEIKTWHRYEEVLRLVTFIVVSRPGHPYEIPESAKVETLNSMALLVSSSAIRAELADGHRLSVLPRPVLDYIRGNKLYKR